MATGFESAIWQKDWNFGEIRGSYERIDVARALGFEPFDGHALQVMIPATKNLGLDMRYKFIDKLGYEPEEVYFRYYLRLASDWNPTTDGGKLPGHHLDLRQGRMGRAQGGRNDGLVDAREL